MEKELISYYDLLGMVKEGNIPKYVLYTRCSKSALYEREDLDGSFFGYRLLNPDEKAYNFDMWLAGNMGEIEMFYKNITIIKNADIKDYGEILDKLLDAVSEEIEHQRDVCDERLKQIREDNLLSCHAVAIEKEHLDSLERIFKKIESIVEDELTEIHY